MSQVHQPPALHVTGASASCMSQVHQGLGLLHVTGASGTAAPSHVRHPFVMRVISIITAFFSVPLSDFAELTHLTSRDLSCRTEYELF